MQELDGRVIFRRYSLVNWILIRVYDNRDASICQVTKNNFFYPAGAEISPIFLDILFFKSSFDTSTFKNEISDLGSTKPPEILIYQPSASIFNMTMLLVGLMSLFASFYQHKYFKKTLFTIPIALFGLGLVGIGLFPGNLAPYHGMSSLLAFLSGGIAAIFSFKIISAPFKYFAIAFGIIGIATWIIAVFATNLIVPFIGLGGTERWIVYPIMLWLTGLGGYLMNTITTKKLGDSYMVKDFEKVME